MSLQIGKKWNGCLAMNKYVESGVVKVQQGRAVDLKEIEKIIVESY